MESKKYLTGEISKMEWKSLSSIPSRMAMDKLLGRDKKKDYKWMKKWPEAEQTAFKKLLEDEEKRFKEDLANGRPAAKILAELDGIDSGCEVTKEIVGKIVELAEKKNSDLEALKEKEGLEPKSKEYKNATWKIIDEWEIGLLKLIQSYAEPKQAKLTKDGWELVGNITVDAGICWLGDPCYILPDYREVSGCLVKDPITAGDLEGIKTGYSKYFYDDNYKNLSKEEQHKVRDEEDKMERISDEKAKALIKKTGALEYMTMLDMLYDANMHGEKDLLNNNHGVARLNHAAGHDGLGVVVSTGYGDGCYNVYVKRKDCGNWGNRVAEVKVVFISDEDEEEDS